MKLFHCFCLIVQLFFLHPVFSASICCAKTAFVSSSMGDDNYSGLSQLYPKKTIKSAIQIADTIMLKSGDVFYEQLVLKGKYVSKYGNGTNPTISGFKTPSRKNAWQKIDKSIWCINLSEDSFMGFDTHGVSRLNNIGCIYDNVNDLVHGNKVRHYKELNKDWDLWQTERFDSNTPPSEFSLLYLYLEDNPNSIDLSFSIGGVGVKMSYSTLDCVNVIGFGFGISAGSDVSIRNCRVDVIGGMTQLGKDWFINYGNGIEFYVSNDMYNSDVHDCYVSRTYDSGISIQAGAENGIPYNIKVYNNLIENCCQGWEDFLMTADENVVFRECEFYENTIINSGNPGFTYPTSRTQFCHIFGLNNKGEKGMIIRDNVFAGGNYYHSTSFRGRYCSNIWRNNICYLSPNDFLLCDHDGSTNKLLVSKDRKFNEKQIEQYRSLTGDDTLFIVCRRQKIRRIIKRLKKSFLSNHTY